MYMKENGMNAYTLKFQHVEVGFFQGKKKMGNSWSSGQMDPEKPECWCASLPVARMGSVLSEEPLPCKVIGKKLFVLVVFPFEGQERWVEGAGSGASWALVRLGFQKHLWKFRVILMSHQWSYTLWWSGNVALNKEAAIDCLSPIYPL